MLNSRVQKLISVSAFVALIATGCGGGGASPDNSGTGNQTPPVNTSGQMVSGKIVGPDGQTPLVNATVFLPSSNGSASPKLQGDLGKVSVSLAGQVGLDCPTPEESFEVAVCTDENGDFSIENTVGSSQLKAVKGIFSTSFDLVQSSEEAIEIGSVEVTTTSGTGASIAVVTGDFDAMENLLAKSGLGDVSGNGRLVLGTEDFQLYDGNDSLGVAYPEFPQLLQNRGDGFAEIYDYDMVFINCGANEVPGFNGIDPEAPETTSVLRQYVEGGGRLYITDLAYDYIEQAFPEIVDFYGSEGTPANEAEFLNEAERGVGGTEIPEASLLNDNLIAFLSNLTCINGDPCLNDNDTIYIEGFLGGWTVMDGLHSDNANAQFLARGFVEVNYNEPILKPLTVSMNIGDGSVFFSSYHTEDLGSTEFLPQERVLQFLLFE